MKKLKLDVETLSVESFDSMSVEEDRGTVRGNASVYLWCQYTGDRFRLECHSEGIECGPTEYYNHTCDLSGPRPCSCPG